MNFDDFPKQFKISQAILLGLLYILLCVLAVGTKLSIWVVAGLFILTSGIVAWVHFNRKEKFVSVSNLCFAGIIYLLLVIALR